MIRLRHLVLLAGLLVAACHDDAAKPPVAQEPPRDAVAEFCGMSMREHPGPKAQIFVQGRVAPYWFASVHDMFAFTLMPEEPRAITAIYVNDMGRARDWEHPEPGTWMVDATIPADVANNAASPVQWRWASIRLDNIVSAAVPEPASLSILGLGALSMLRRRRA